MRDALCARCCVRQPRCTAVATHPRDFRVAPAIFFSDSDSEGGGRSGEKGIIRVGAGGASDSYAARVKRMCASNSESLDVNYHHLSHAVPILAIWVADAPREMLKLLDEAAMEVVRVVFPDYDLIHPTVHVRITDLPIEDPIRDLRQAHVGCLVKVSGVVTRRSQVFPQLCACKYTCLNCSYLQGPYAMTDEGGEHHMRGVPCPSCQSTGPYALNTEETVYWCANGETSCAPDLRLAGE